MAKKIIEEKPPEQPGIPMYQKAPSDLAIPNEFKIGNQLLNKATLIAQRNEDVKHVVAGIEDTAGYKKAVELRATYRTTRTSLEKFRKEKSLPHQEFVKKLKEATDELGKECAIAEEYFSDMITAVDNEKARIKAEAERLEQQRVQSRINRLVELGAKFDGEIYTLPYNDGEYINSMDVKNLPDESFEVVIGEFKEAFDIEQARIEQERLEAEQEAEKVKQQAEANETERKKLLEQRTTMRVKELTKLHGFEFDANVYTKHYFVILDEIVESMPDQEWEALMTEVENYETESQKVIVPSVFEEEVVPDVLGMATDLNVSTTFDVDENNPALIVTSGDIKTVERVLKFDGANTHFDVYISLKRTVRFFFDEFKQDALAGCEVDKEGNYQGLHWAIIKT